MQAIVEACQQNRLPAEVVAVISNRPNAAGLDFAKQNHIATIVIDHTTFAQREDFDKALAKALNELNADWIACAGFMRVLGTAAVTPFLGKMINIHPSLLPKHPGLNTHASALAAGDKQHGATVHFVTPELDAGPIIAHTVIDVLPNDTKDSLAARVLLEEHELYIRALMLCLNGQANFETANGHNT